MSKSNSTQETQTHSPHLIPDLSDITDLEPLKCRGGLVPLRNDPGTLVKIYAVHLSPNLPGRELLPCGLYMVERN